MDSAARFQELLQPLASSIRTLYPGWRMRIYHNVTQQDSKVWTKFCQLYCDHDHLDLCDTRQLPGVGDLHSQWPVGRFWRFQVVGDPTVAVFGCRDVDSYVLPRERAAVAVWLESGHQYHVMRDLPLHHAPMLAGLWGGSNYHNFSLALQVRQALLGVKVNLWKFYDQHVLQHRVWPLVRNKAVIHDSFNCRHQESLGPMQSWPTRRKGFTYVGYGPSKGMYSRILRRTKCPRKCRPEGHQDWMYC